MNLNNNIEELVQFLIESNHPNEMIGNVEQHIQSTNPSDNIAMEWLIQKKQELSEHDHDMMFDYISNPTQYPINNSTIKQYISYLSLSWSANVRLKALELIYSIGFNREPSLFTQNLFDHIYLMMQQQASSNNHEIDIYTKIQQEIKWLLQSAARSMKNIPSSIFGSMLNVWNELEIDYTTMDSDEIWEYFRIIQAVNDNILYEIITQQTYDRNKILCNGYARKNLLVEIGEVISKYYFKSDKTITRMMEMYKNNHDIQQDVMCIIGNMLNNDESGNLCKDLVFEHQMFPTLKSNMTKISIIWQIIQRHDVWLMQEFIDTDYFKMFTNILEKEKHHNFTRSDHYRDEMNVLFCIRCFFYFSSEQQLLNTISMDMIESVLVFISSASITQDVHQQYEDDFAWLVESIHRVFVVEASKPDTFKKFMVVFERCNGMKLIQQIQQNYPTGELFKFCEKIEKLVIECLHK